MKRRPKGTGTIVKMGSVYYGRIVVRGNVKVVRLSANQRESEALWKKWLVENVLTLKTDAVKHRVAELWPLVKDILVGRGCGTRRVNYHKTIFGAITDCLGRHGVTYVEDIDRGTVLTVLDELTDGDSTGKKKEYLCVMREIFKAAGVNRPEPLEEIRFRREVTRPREPFTDGEIAKILDAANAKGREWGVLVEIGLYTGLRLVDCVHLKAENVRDGVIELMPEKTKHWHGTTVRIPLHPKLAATLDSLGVSHGNYLPEIVHYYGNHTLNAKLKKLFGVVGETSVDVGRKRKVSVKGFHALRATFITRLAERGVGLPIMESLAGHINPQQTIHYTHPNEDVKKSAIAVLPDFAVSPEGGSPFVHPEVQRVVDICKRQIEETIERVLGKKVDVQVSTKEILGGAEAFFNL